MKNSKIKLVLGKDIVIEGHPGENMNAIAVGPPGVGKTYSFMTPNITMADNCSLFVDDKKGTLYSRHKNQLEQRGYKVFCFDLVRFNGNMQYNMFSSIKDRGDVKRLATFLLPDKHIGKETFWVLSARDLAECLIEMGMIFFDDFNLRDFMRMLYGTSMLGHGDYQTNEPDEIDIMQLQCSLEKRNRMASAYKRYRGLRGLATDTWTSVRGTCISTCSAFDRDDLFSITETTNIELDVLGKEKTAIFVTSSDTDSTLTPMVQLLYSDMCNKLIQYADLYCDGNNNQLPYHVRFLLDDFASGARMDNFENIIANCRSRNISFLLGIQSLSQLDAIYEKQSNSIMDCINYKIYFTSSNQKTIDYISTVMDIPAHDVRQMKVEDICIEMLGRYPEFYKRYETRAGARNMRR